MTINQLKEGSKLTIELSGELDLTTSPELASFLNEHLDGVTELNFDFAELKYISSAGLRVILSAQKTMSKQGTMYVKNCNETVREVFEITGFDSIMNIL